jgi:dihydrodipicolinate synthase/N-acetylneuraminate lyase
MHFTWEGVFPALTTKFNSEDLLDLQLFELNLRTQVDAGVNGVVLGGTLGEASVLLEDEKKQLVELTVAHAGNLPVILNIAEGSTKEALRQVKNAETWGASGLMLLPPMRYKPDHREAIVFFKTIADSTSLPIMLYNNPVDYKTEVTLEMFDELSSCSNIQAVKESTRDVTNVTRMINRFGDRYKIMCGVDTLAMEEITLGANGWIAGLVCAFPKETVRLYELIIAGKYNEAKEIYRWFMPLLELDIHPKLVQYIKFAEMMTGIGSEYVRPPRLSLVGEERERISAVISEGIKNRPSL